MKRLSRIAIAMIAMTGRVTMLGISRWAGKGGSYRTIQRFFNAIIPWSLVFKLFFETHLSNPEGEKFLVGDECVVTKAGKETHGLDYFFSGLLNKVVKGVAIFTLAVVDVNERRSYPLSVEQVIRTEAEKEATKTKKKAKIKKDPNAPKKKPCVINGVQNLTIIGRTPGIPARSPQPKTYFGNFQAAFAQYPL